MGKKPLDIWLDEYPVDEEMYWKGAALQSINKIFCFSSELEKRSIPFVLSTHRSKSITLPVVEVQTSYGVRCILRDNFHDIKISVEAEKPVNHDLFGLTAGGDSYLHPVYFEGFQEKWIHPPFTMGASKFSVCLSFDTLISFARALKWYFTEKEKEYQKIPKKDEYCRRELCMRRVAVDAQFPVLCYRGPVSGLYRFFKPDEHFPPDAARLRHVFWAKEGTPIPYINLDFSSGCPEPVDDWLTALDPIIGERRRDETIDRLGGRTGARVNIYRLTPELKARAEELGCLELLRPNDER